MLNAYICKVLWIQRLKKTLVLDEEGEYISECLQCLWKWPQRSEEGAEEIQRRGQGGCPMEGGAPPFHFGCLDSRPDSGLGTSTLSSRLIGKKGLKENTQKCVHPKKEALSLEIRFLME